MTYDFNGKKLRIPDEEIERTMRTLELSKEEAIEIWLEDNEYLDNEEQNALDRKAKENHITATIHQARSEKPKTPRKVERKADTTKEGIISKLAEVLTEMADEVKVENVGKLITFKLNGDTFKLDLIRQRPPKEKKGK